jgi:hypothetical protein
VLLGVAPVGGLDVRPLGVAALGVAAPGVAAALAADVPPESSDVDAYNATLPTVAATATNTTTSTMRRPRWLRPIVIYATLTNDRLLTVSS